MLHYKHPFNKPSKILRAVAFSLFLVIDGRPQKRSHSRRWMRIASSTLGQSLRARLLPHARSLVLWEHKGRARRCFDTIELTYV
jgi:hypothetical protein